MKKAVVILVVVGGLAGTVVAIKKHQVPKVKGLPEPLVKYLKNSDVVSPKTVKTLGKKVDSLLGEASKKNSIPVLADILNKATSINADQQKKLAKYLKKNFS